MIKLGDKVKDVVTGYTGIATSRTEFLNGCVQIAVLPKQSAEQRKNDGYPDGVKLDIEQLVKVGEGVNIPKLKIAKTATGGPPSRGDVRNRH